MIELFAIIMRTLILSIAVAAALFGSWIIVCGAVYIVSAWLKYEYSRALATALWIVLVSLIGFSRWE